MKQNILFCGLIFVAYLALQFIAGIIVSYLGLAFLPGQGTLVSLFIISVFVIVGLFLFRTWRQIGLKWSYNWRALKLLWLPGFYIVLNCIEVPFQYAGISILVMAIFSSILVGFSEEVVFRGAILSVLLPYGKMMAVISSGLLFGFIHFLNLSHADLETTLIQVLYSTVIGIVFGGLRIRLNSLWPIIGVHTGMDFTALHAEAAGLALPETNLWPLLFVLPLALYGVFLVKSINKKDNRA